MLNSKNNGMGNQVPHHVAIIMDGNGRWAESRNMVRVKGHQQGAVAVRRVIEAAATRGIGVLTLFAFSSENWKRPQLEVSALMALFAESIKKEKDNLIRNGIRTVITGEKSRFSASLRKAIEDIEEATSGCSRMLLNIAANYGGRWDITQAARKLAVQVRDGQLDADSITESALKANLCVVDDVDLLIRTGGESRISNFLMWQAAYSELYFSPTLWPDYSEKDLDEAIEFFNKRERRFGMTSAQVRKLEK